MNIRSIPVTLALLTCAACSGSDQDGTGSGASDPDLGAVTDGCERGKLEADLTLTGLTGPDVVDGKLAAPPEGGYVVSSTFLRMKAGDAAKERFNELLAPIIASLPQRPGLRAFQLGIAAECNTARTLSVWADTDAMYDFVTGDEHLAAASAVSEVSRGASVVVHWAASSAEDASWTRATEELAAAKGPFY